MDGTLELFQDGASDLAGESPMPRGRFLVVTFLVLSFALGGAPQARADLVGWWKFEGNADDAIGGNNGTLTGSPFFTTAYYGQGIQFTGHNDAVTVPDGPAFKITRSLSIRATIYVNGLPGQWGMIFFRGDERSGLDPYFLAIRSNGDLVFHVEGYSGGDEIFAPVPIGRFINVLGTLDNNSGRFRLYIDDVLVAEKITSVRPFSELDPWYKPGIGIGNHASIPASIHRFFFNGIIDDIKLYNTAEQPQPRVTGLKLSKASVPGGQSITGRVVLNRAAPPGGAAVSISENLAAASAPSTVTVPAGKTYQDFTIDTATTTLTEIGAVTARYVFSSVSAKLTVRPISVLSLTLNPSSVKGGDPVSGTVTLELPAAPGAIQVSLSSSNAKVAAPTVTAITIPTGSTTGTFTIATQPVTAVTTVAIRAKANGLTKSASLTVNPPELYVINGQNYMPTGTPETMTATFTKADGGISVGSFHGYVLLTVSGVGQSYGGTYNDAFYLYTSPFSTPTNGHDGGFYQLTFGTTTIPERSLANNAKNFLYGSLPAYSASHEYKFILNTKVAAAAQLHFGVSDGGFSDNTGAYTIKITQLIPSP